MKKILLAVLMIPISLFCCAQYYDDSPQLVISSDAALLLNKPVSTTNYPGVGATAKITIPTGNFSDIVLIGSLMSFRGKEVVKGNKTVKAQARNLLPLLIGYRRYLNPLYNYNTWYIEPRVGLTLDGTKNRAITVGAALGYLINNKIDLSIRYQSFGGSEYAHLSFLGLNIGYGFSLH
ncbi:porin family protein [Filimonas effusa]|uniref:Outer membrane protein beta-barrel domain-containing protein n=1 Tax=Filimonas effusa TaxID=2508721 RepID=A0A4Q1DF85_9BACT|nr:hypothetical protein [Filimonas effusa]RXK87363.1 hypothetical protein ESB13_11460 [Filimonas effusa]